MIRSTQNSRSIRVFVSSTFIDMQREREELVKHIFPKLRNASRMKNVGFNEVDLRWGITKEESKSGKVIPICLNEIDNCRPFFIGILGHRYGTLINESIKEFPESLLSEYPWLKNEYLRINLTELEILYAVFTQQAKTSHAYFYFLEPGNPDSNHEEHIEHTALNKLDMLKRKIIDSGYPFRFYRNSEHLGELIYKDFQQVIENLFPVETTPDPIRNDARLHNWYELEYSKIYFGRKEDFNRLDRHVEGKGKFPLVVTGQSGTGKSALLAGWLQYRKGKQFSTSFQLSTSILQKMSEKVHCWFQFKKKSNSTCIAHFVGASSESTNWKNIIVRILTFFQYQLNLPISIPNESIKLISVFQAHLESVSKNNRVIIIIDGLDKLEDLEQAPDLGWLPEKTPKNIRFILSTNEGPSLTEMKRRGWPIFEVSPLSLISQKPFIENYLKIYGKKLPLSQINQIKQAPQTKNALFLKSLLEELRLFGDFELLQTRITHYCESDSPEMLFKKIIERIEADFEPKDKKKHVVRNSLMLICTARKGITEDELLTMLGTETKPLPYMHWSPLYLALKDFLVDQSGILKFFHHSFRRAVEEYFFKRPSFRIATHRHLADYFQRQPLTIRKIDELPWHLTALESWKELYQLLTDLHFLRKAWLTHQYEIRYYWDLLQQKSKFTIANGYAQVINNPEKFNDFTWQVCMLLLNTSHENEMLKLCNYLEQKARNMDNKSELQSCLSLQATISVGRRKYDEALALFNEQKRLCRELSNMIALSACLGNLGAVYLEKNELAIALQYFKEEESILSESKDFHGISVNFGNQGIIQLKKRNLNLALKLFREQEALCRRIGDKGGLYKCLLHQGSLFQKKGKYTKAVQLHKEVESICLQLGDREGIQLLLGQRALAAQDLGNYDNALELFEEREKVCISINNTEGLAKTLICKADLFAIKIKQPGYALRFVQEAHRIALSNQLHHLLPETEKRLKTFNISRYSP